MQYVHRPSCFCARLTCTLSMLHRCPQWTWKDLSPRTLYVAMKYLAQPFKEQLDDPYLSYKEPIEPAESYDPLDPYGYRARPPKPPVAKQSPFGRLFTAAEVTKSVPDVHLLDHSTLGASVAKFEEHEATARLAVQSIVEKLNINADSFANFEDLKSTSILSTTCSVLAVSLRHADTVAWSLRPAEIKSDTLLCMSEMDRGILNETTCYVRTNDQNGLVGQDDVYRNNLKYTFRNAGTQFLLGFSGKTAADFESAGKCGPRSCVTASIASVVVVS